jgi:hypothetical protein
MRKNILISVVVVLAIVLVALILIQTFKVDEKNVANYPEPETVKNNKFDKVFLLGGSMSAGEFSGVGIGFAPATNDGSLVQRVYPNSPGEKAGIRQNDVMKKIGDTVLTQSHGITGVENLLRGPKDTYVTISVERNGNPLDFQVKRELICCDTRHVSNNDIFTSQDFQNWETYAKGNNLPIAPLYTRMFFVNGKVVLLNVKESTIESAISSDLINWMKGSKAFEIPAMTFGEDGTRSVYSSFYFGAGANKLFSFINSQDFVYQFSGNEGMDGAPISSVTSTKTILASTDGLTWVELENPAWWKDCQNCSTSIENTFKLKEKIFVITMEANSVADINNQKHTLSIHSSADGVVWETTKLDLPTQTVIVPFGDKIIAYSYDTQSKMTEVRFSIDGKTWTKQENITFMNPGSYISPVYFYELNGEMYIQYSGIEGPQACSPNGCYYKSKDGIVWEKIDLTNTLLSKIQAGLYIVLPETFGVKQ